MFSFSFYGAQVESLRSYIEPAIDTEIKVLPIRYFRLCQVQMIYLGGSYNVYQTLVSIKHTNTYPEIRQQLSDNVAQFRRSLS